MMYLLPNSTISINALSLCVRLPDTMKKVMSCKAKRHTPITVHLLTLSKTMTLHIMQITIAAKEEIDGEVDGTSTNDVALVAYLTLMRLISHL